jgi:hypothetical protein
MAKNARPDAAIQRMATAQIGTGLMQNCPVDQMQNIRSLMANSARMNLYALARQDTLDLFQ